jgi:hypothetical protein
MAFVSRIPRSHQDPPRLTVREDKVLDFDIDDVDGPTATAAGRTVRSHAVLPADGDRVRAARGRPAAPA